MEGREESSINRRSSEEVAALAGRVCIINQTEHRGCYESSMERCDVCSCKGRKCIFFARGLSRARKPAHHNYNSYRTTAASAEDNFSNKQCSKTCSCSTTDDQLLRASVRYSTKFKASKLVKVEGGWGQGTLTGGCRRRPIR